MPTSLISRREFVSAAAVAATLPVVAGSSRTALAAAQTSRYVPPPSPQARINFNLNWKFIREDVTGEEGSSRLGRFALDNHQCAPQL